MEEDNKEQKNKRHNKINDKLKKRWKQEKEIKKLKKKKKQEYDKEKQKQNFFNKKDIIKEKDIYGINTLKLLKRFKKFLNYYNEEIEEFKNLFLSLDQGLEVDLSEIEEKTKKYISKIFKCLKLKELNASFSKPELYKIKDLYNYVKKIIQNITENQDSSSSQSEEIQTKKQQIIQKIEDLNKNTQKNSNSNIQNLPIVLNPPDQVIGPLVPQEILIQKQKEIVNQLQNFSSDSKREDWMLGEWEDLDKKFEKKENQLRDFLDKRKKPQQKKQEEIIDPQKPKKNIYAEGSASLEDDGISQEKLQEYMKQYDEQFRKKSLLQEYQEGRPQMNYQKNPMEVNEGDRKRFNRDTEMQFNTVDSKRLFQAMKDSDVLKSKFSSGNIQRNFL